MGLLPCTDKIDLLYICSHFIGPFLILAGGQQYLSCSVYTWAQALFSVGQGLARAIITSHARCKEVRHGSCFLWAISFRFKLEVPSSA